MEAAICPSNSCTNRRLMVVTPAELEAALSQASTTLVDDLPELPPTPTPACLRTPFDHALVSFYGFGHAIAASASVATKVGACALAAVAGVVLWPFVYAYEHGREKMGHQLDQLTFMSPTKPEFWIRTTPHLGMVVTFMWFVRILFVMFLGA